jgi:uncharacterized membrane protein YhaH (DUF805 family)
MREYKKALKGMFKLEGRLRRREYWVSKLINVAILYILYGLMFGISAIAGHSMFYSDSGSVGFSTSGHIEQILFVILIVLFTIYYCLFSIFVGVKRFHDAGFSGGMYALSLVLSIFGVGSIMNFVICVLDSKDDNEYGENPKSDMNNEYESGASIGISVAFLIFSMLFMTGCGILNIFGSGLMPTGNSETSTTTVETDEEDNGGYGLEEDNDDDSDYYDYSDYEDTEVSETDTSEESAYVEETTESEWSSGGENNVYYMSLGDNTWSFKVPDTVDSSSVSASQYSIYYETPEGLAIEYADSFCTVGEYDPMTYIQEIYEGTPTQVTVADKDGYIADLSDSEWGYYKFVVYVNVGETNYLEMMVTSYDSVLTQEDVLAITTNSLQ